MSESVESEPTAEEKARHEALQEFHIARSKALNTYASLEHHMALAVDTLLGTIPQKSYTAFSAVKNNQMRLGMLERLVHISYPSEKDGPGKYDNFIKGYIERIEWIAKAP